MQQGEWQKALFASAVLAAILVATPVAQAKVHRAAPQTAHQMKQQAHVRREIRSGMHRERGRHKARMQELSHRSRMARRAKDLDEQQRVRDLVMAERLLFAQRMRDLRSKAPVDR